MEKFEEWRKSHSVYAEDDEFSPCDSCENLMANGTMMQCSGSRGHRLKYCKELNYGNKSKDS